jgi:predicted kinase
MNGEFLDEIQHPGPFFVMLSGLPGAGKSTLRAQFESVGIHLSTDDLIENAAAWRGLTYNDVFFAEIKPATAAVNAAFRQALKDGVSIVWDQTNLTEKKRRGVLSQLPKEYYSVSILVQTDETTRQTRLLNRRGNDVPAHIDKSMRESMVLPTESEGFDMVVVVNT